MKQEFSKFLKVTLQSESLSTHADKERNKLLKLLQTLFADYDSLAPNSGDEGSVSSSKDTFSGSLEESRSTVDSHGSEEDSYVDNIADTTVKALSEPTKMGFLERRQDKLFTSSWQKRYCVLHKNIFYIFKKTSDKKQQGAFIVSGYEFREAPYLARDDKKKELFFELVCPAKKTYQFMCENKDDLQSWKVVIQAAAISQPSTEHDGDIYEEFGESGDKPKNQQTEVGEFYVDAESEKSSAKPSRLAKLGAVSSKFGSLFPKGDSKKEVKEEVKGAQADEDDLIYEPIDSAPSPEPPTKVPTPLVNISRSLLLSASTPPSSVPSKSPTSASEDQPPALPPHRGLEAPSSAVKEQELPPLPLHRPPDTSQIPPPLPGRALPPPPTEPLPPIPATPKKMISPTMDKIRHPSEDFENLFYGMWDCAGATTNELSFKRGQIVHVISRELDDWWVAALENQVGLVPKSYLCPAYELVR